MTYDNTSPFARLCALIKRQPVRTAYVVGSVAVTVAAYFNVVLDEATTVDIVKLVLAIAAGGEVTRRKVSPI